MKLVGGGKRSIIIQFVADTVKAARDIDNLTKKMDRARAMSGRSGTTGGYDRSRFERIFSQPITGMGMGNWDRDWYRNPNAAPFTKRGKEITSWQQGMISRTRGPIPTLDRNAEFLARKAGISIGKLGESSGKASNSILGMVGKFGGLGSVTGNLISKFGKLGLLIAGLVTTLNHIVKHSNLIEGNLIQMEILLGNEARANQMMKDAIEFSLITPFTPEETFSAVTSSLQYKIDPFRKGAYGLQQNQNVMQILAGLGSFRGQGTGGRPIGIDRATHAVMYGDRRLLRPFMGYINPAYEKAKKTGLVGTPQWRETFIRELGKIPEIMAMAERHSDSMAGMWSTIKGFAEEFWIAIGGASEMSGVTTFWSQFKLIVRDIRDYGLAFVQYIKPGLTEMGSALGSIFKFVWDTFKRIGEILGPILIPALKLMWQIFRLIFVAVEQVLYFVMWIIRVVVKFVSIFVSYIDKLTGISDKIKAMTNWMVDFIAGMKAAFELDKIYLEWLVDNIGVKYDAFVSRILGKLREVWNFLKRFYSEHHRVIDFFLTFGMSEALPTNKNRSILGNVSNAAGVVAQGAGEIKKLVQSNTTGGRVARAVLSAGMTEVLPGVPRPVQNNPQNTTNNTNINVTNNQAPSSDVRDLTRTITGLMIKNAVPTGVRR